MDSDTDYTAPGAPVACLPTRQEWERTVKLLAEAQATIVSQSNTIAQQAQSLKETQETLIRQAALIAKQDASLDAARRETDAINAQLAEMIRESDNALLFGIVHLTETESGKA